MSKHPMDHAECVHHIRLCDPCLKCRALGEKYKREYVEEYDRTMASLRARIAAKGEDR